MARTWKFCKPLTLASASPRRRELLSEVAQDLVVTPADVDESGVVAASPRALVKELSRLKARAVAALPENDGRVVVGADTVVYLDKIYGKPRDFDDAVKMILALSGKWHYVFTGVTVIYGGREITFSVRSAVLIKELDREQAQEYVRAYEPYDKAGGYAVQEGAVTQDYSGSYTNIVGLPMERLREVLRSLG